MAARPPGFRQLGTWRRKASKAENSSLTAMRRAWKTHRTESSRSSFLMGALVGDTNGDGLVNSGDALQTRNRSGQATDASNFRSDVNVDGVVNSGATTVVRVRSGGALP